MNNANLYERANAMQKRDTVNLLNEFSPSLDWQSNRSELVLDIGCGSGDVTTDILMPTITQGCKSKQTTIDISLVGVDKSVDMIQHARQKYGTAKNVNANNNNNSNNRSSRNRNNNSQIVEKKNISFSILDISREIPQTRLTRKFSKIFSFYCLHWIKEQVRPVSRRVENVTSFCVN
jgi:juvenile hormone acid methyltransferase